MPGSESQSPRPSMPLWLILVTLLGGAFLVQRGNQPAEDKGGGAPPTSHAGTEAASSDANDRLLAPLREFLGLTLQPSKLTEPSVLGNLSLEMPLPERGRVRASAEWVGQTPAVERGKDQTDLSLAIKGNVGLLEFLVVTVADPIDTATNLRFDLQLDTLHKALGADGYVPDHYYLPWNPQDKANRHRSEPGVLLYRRNGPSLSKCSNSQRRIDLLLVYLVGETPTSGIHKEAFLTAVRQVQTLRKMACRPDLSPQTIPQQDSRPTIRVAGPLFTGTADSLALAIRQSSEEMKKMDTGDEQNIGFQIITTAVSINKAHFQTLAGNANVDLHSTVLSGAILKEALIRHVRDRNWKKVRIAWLTETGTGYGASSSADQGNSATGQKTIEPIPEPLPAPDSRAEIIEFRFPANISKVRSSYTESRRRERSSQANLGPENSRLPIPFDDTHTARDVPPMQTPKVTAPSVELILSQILTTIRSEGIKYVGISSSDPRDPIFLAELIQEQCPDVQIMLVTSDVLHLHSEYRSIMHGTLVSSTYPLHPEAQDLCFPFGENRNGTSRSTVMPNQYNYGLYNAVLFLRGLERGQYTDVHLKSADGKHAGESANLLKLSYSKEEQSWPGGLPLGYSLPFEENIVGECGRLRPPVWISRIGSTGICPVTVQATDKLDIDKYTLDLQIDLPPNSKLLPELHRRSRVPVSLYISSLLWLVVAAVYCAAILFPKLVGNWAKALATVADHPQEFQGLIYVFRAYLTCSFITVLKMFETLLYTYHYWVGQHVHDYVPLVQSLLCAGVAIILILCLLADWVRAFWGLACDLWGALIRLYTYWESGPVVAWRRESWGQVDEFCGALKRLFAYLRNGPRANRGRTLQAMVGELYAALQRLFASLRSGPAPVVAGTTAQEAEPDLSWHLISARGIGLTIILALAIIFVSVAIVQRGEWRTETGGWDPNTFLWFMRNSDMWNGLSPVMTSQLQALVLIILAYGMLLQMHLLSPEFTIIKPDPSASTRSTDDERKRRQQDVRNALLFPLLSRWRRNRPVVLDILCVAATLLWLGFLGWHVQGLDHFSQPVSFSTTLLLLAGGFWCVRLFKMIQILKGLARHLEEITNALRERWPNTWPRIFELLSERPVGLQELLWASRPTVNDREWSKAKQALQEVQPDEAGRLQAEQKLCAIEIELYVRQFFHHVVRLGLGLVVSACLLFLSAQAFPFSQEPLLRLSASIMLAAIGCVMAWYYLKFDRNELLSRLVGTDPKHVSVNWSLIQMIAPALLLTLVALLSQTFPEIWQWMRGVLEPMARSSI